MRKIAQIFVCFSESPNFNKTYIHDRGLAHGKGKDGQTVKAFITYAEYKSENSGTFSDRYVQFVKSPYLVVLINYMVPEVAESFRNTFGQASRNFYF